MGNTRGTVSLCSLVPSSNFAHSIKIDAIDASANVLDSRNNPEHVSEISWLSKYELTITPISASISTRIKT